MVERTDELIDRQGRDRGDRHRDRHLEQEAEIAAAIYDRGFADLMRDLEETLPHHIDRLAADQERQRQTKVRIDQPPGLSGQVVGNHCHFGGDHHRRKDRVEDESLPLELEERESISRHTGENDLGYHNDQTVDKRVEQVAEDRNIIDHKFVVLDRQVILDLLQGRNIFQIFVRDKAEHKTDQQRRNDQQSDGELYDKGNRIACLFFEMCLPAEIIAVCSH